MKSSSRKEWKPEVDAIEIAVADGINVLAGCLDDVADLVVNNGGGCRPIGRCAEVREGRSR